VLIELYTLAELDKIVAVVSVQSGFCLKKNPKINGLTGAQRREVVVVASGSGDDGLLVFLHPHPCLPSVYSIGPVQM